jgi:DNA-3-methyladenine glycosylase
MVEKHGISFSIPSRYRSSESVSTDCFTFFYAELLTLYQSLSAYKRKDSRCPSKPEITSRETKRRSSIFYIHNRIHGLTILNDFKIPLPHSFYLRPALSVAQELLGCFFVKRCGKEFLTGKIVEVEAYKQNDPASHSFRGRTQRNNVMFLDGGRLYVYFTYGMHFCANVVTGPEGTGEAVLIRAVEPFTGIETMFKNRYGAVQFPAYSIIRFPDHPISPSFIGLTNGPAKFCKAFEIGRSENGTDLMKGDLFITKGLTLPASAVGRSPRIGISEGLGKKWRFFIKGNPWVSKSASLGKSPAHRVI